MFFSAFKVGANRFSKNLSAVRLSNRSSGVGCYLSYLAVSAQCMWTDNTFFGGGWGGNLWLLYWKYYPYGKTRIFFF